MARTGRPKKDIPKDQFEKLCGLQCTEEEIAGYFNCSIETISRFCKREYKTTFVEVYKKLSANGKISLRRNQFRLSEKNAAMAIWLGKQYLGQREVIMNECEANGRLADLINGLKIDDIHGETAGPDETVAEEQTKEN